MNNAPAILITCVLMNFGSISAQSSLVLPDTINPTKSERAYAVKDLTTFRVMDTIVSPEMFVVYLPIPWASGYDIQFAIPDKDSFAIYPLNVRVSGVDIHRTHINGTGRREIIIDWRYDENISRWGDWHYYHQRGTMIIDPDSMTVLLDLATYNSRIAIWETYYPDSSGPNGELIAMSGGSESTCESYTFVFNAKGFSLQENADCPEQNDWEMNDYQITDNNKYDYVFTPSGYVRIK